MFLLVKPGRSLFIYAGFVPFILNWPGAVHFGRSERSMETGISLGISFTFRLEIVSRGCTILVLAQTRVFTVVSIVA